ncbi:hypothetical protein MOV66_10215 [Agrobacterium sp. SHOUNA12C]|nr:hypothetical protein [Agrobacterium sp. BETTINA12B]MCJ9757017.1 hypothetical protein [Agrobacterium sp. SHOUNA12C]
MVKTKIISRTFTEAGEEHILYRHNDCGFVYTELQVIDHLAAERERQRKIERDRRLIERQCKKAYWRNKYAGLGLWPVPSDDTQ